MKIDCPAQTKIKAWVEDRLPQEESTLIEGHLEACESCREIADQALQTPQWDKHGATSDPPPIQPTNNDGSDSSAESRFRVIRPYAKGGLGEVFVAEDQELHREVALKEIQARFRNDAAARQRFLQEGEITGRLEHPGIVPVYGLGAYPDGRPFYAMRFIKGETLRQAIERFHASGERFDSVQFRRLLERFLSVCHAVAYAHSRGVLHRDIKPNNVMLGEFGETLLVDWGLAKVIGRPEPIGEATLRPTAESTVEETGAGVAVGTPSYMSPEQAEGTVKSLGPATDVYSLGATLYCILTGKPPITDENLQRLLEKVRRSEIIHPDQIRKDAPKALAAICLKAMSPQPKNRYGKMSELIEEIERWLADEPVQALQDPWSDRLRRWARKHRALVITALAVLLTGSIGLTIGLFFVNVEKNRTEIARQAEAKRAEEALQANRQSQTRLEQLQKSNEILGSILKDLDPQSEELGGDNLRVQLGKRLGEATQQLKEEKIGDPVVVARLQMLLGRSLRELGYYAEAVQVLEIAYQTLEQKLSREHEDSLTCGSELAHAYLTAGQGKKALSLGEQLLKESEGKLGPEHALTLDISTNLAVTYQRAGQLEKALPMLQRTFKVREAKLGPDHPDTINGRNNLAMAYDAAGQFDKALPLLEQSLKFRETKLGSTHPLTDINRNNLALVYQETGQLDKALPLLEQSLKASESKLGPEHPQTLVRHNNLATAYRNAGQLDKALPLFEQTLKASEMKLGPEHPDYLTKRINLATVYKDAGQFDKALPLFEQTLKTCEGKLGPDHPLTLANRHNLAMAYRAAKQLDKAEPLFEQTLKIREAKLGPDHPETISTRNTLAKVYLAEGRFSLVESLLQGPLNLARKNSSNPWMTADAQCLLGEALYGKKEYTEAEGWLLQGWKGLNQEQQKIPPILRNRLLKEALERLVKLYDGWGKPEEAARWRKELAELPKQPTNKPTGTPKKP